MTEDTDTYYADGFEEAILGVNTEGAVPRIVYDKWAMVYIYREQNPDCEWDEAVEFLEFNVWGSYVGLGTPMYIRTFSGSVDQNIVDINDYVDQHRE